MSAMLRDSEFYRRRIRRHELKIVMLQAEIDRRRHRIQEAAVEIERLREHRERKNEELG